MAEVRVDDNTSEYIDTTWLEFDLNDEQWSELNDWVRQYFPDNLASEQHRHTLSRLLGLHVYAMRQAVEDQVRPAQLRNQLQRMADGLEIAADAYFGEVARGQKWRAIELLDLELGLLETEGPALEFGRRIIELGNAVRGALDAVEVASGRPSNQVEREAFAAFVFQLRWWASDFGCFPVKSSNSRVGDGHSRAMADLVWLAEGWLPQEARQHRQSKPAMTKAIRRSLPDLLSWFRRRYPDGGETY